MPFYLAQLLLGLHIFGLVGVDSALSVGPLVLVDPDVGLRAVLLSFEVLLILSQRLVFPQQVFVPPLQFLHPPLLDIQVPRQFLLLGLVPLALRLQLVLERLDDLLVLLPLLGYLIFLLEFLLEVLLELVVLLLDLLLVDELRAVLLEHGS